MACHGAAGEGGVGPNLTDEYWVHGGGVKNVFKTIKYGVPSKGMISWESKFTPGQIQELASYILTFQGTNPAGGKDPEGEVWLAPEMELDSVPEMNDSLAVDTLVETEEL